MKIKFLVLFLFIALSTGTLFALDRSRKIVSPEGVAKVALTKSLYTQVDANDMAMQRLVYTSYVAGFLDAMELEAIDDGAAKRFLQECDGSTLGDLVDTMSKFYADNPKLRDTKPSTILTVVAPRIKKGLTPLP